MPALHVRKFDFSILRLCGWPSSTIGQTVDLSSLVFISRLHSREESALASCDSCGQFRRIFGSEFRVLSTCYA
jgi:hypothetical protein